MAYCDFPLFPKTKNEIEKPPVQQGWDYSRRQADSGGQPQRIDLRDAFRNGRNAGTGVYMQKEIASRVMSAYMLVVGF